MGQQACSQHSCPKQCGTECFLNGEMLTSILRPLGALTLQSLKALNVPPGWQERSFALLLAVTGGVGRSGGAGRLDIGR